MLYCPMNGTATLTKLEALINVLESTTNRRWFTRMCKYEFTKI